MMTLPTLAPTKAEILRGISHWYDLVHEVMSAEAGRAFLRQQAYLALHEGTYPTARVIEAAEAGHPGADWALRRYAAEFIDYGREAELSIQIRAYVVRALVRPVGAYPQGRKYADIWTRDIAIAVMVDEAARRWNLSRTRNNATARKSAAHYVEIVMRRKGYKLKERQINEIVWRHNRVADQLVSVLKNSLNRDDTPNGM
jgi:hypothetical protein